MTKLIISSNVSGNNIDGVGSAILQGATIQIKASPGSEVTLTRGENNIVLIKARDIEQTTSGPVQLGDFISINNNGKTLNLNISNNEPYQEKEIYVNEKENVTTSTSKQKTTLTIGVLILFLLVVSVFFGLRQKKTNDFTRNSEESLNQAVASYEKSISEFEIDVKSSRELFVLSKETAEKLKNDGYKSDKLEELLNNINQNEANILGEIQAETDELLDLTLQVNGFEGKTLTSTNENIFIFDPTEKNVVQVDYDGKNAKVFAKKEDIGDAESIASYEDRLFTLEEEGIYEIDKTRTRVKELEIEDSLFYLYSANIYLLDRSANQIYRFAGSGKTFGDKSDWLAPGIEADFSKVTDIVIDGSIWLLSSSGKVTKFTNGNPISITLEAIVDPLENPTAIYTNEELKQVYILEKGKGRVVVIDKTGEFKLQYVSEEIKNATDLVVSEEEGKIILLTGSKLIYLPLSQ